MFLRRSANMNSQGLTRSQAKLIISMSPGIHLRKLQKLLGTSFTTTRYHVDGLERDGEIVRHKDGRYDRLYPAGTAEHMKQVYAVLQSKTARRILAAMVEAGGLSASGTELSEELEVSRSSLTEYFGLLSGAGLVKRRSPALDGRTVYAVQDLDEARRLLTAFQKGVLSFATDGFIDLWDM